MGYHSKKINKGILGERSKIIEEFNEWLDSCEQNVKLMEFIELSDLLGAIEAYLKPHNLSLNDLITMNERTKSAFQDGER